MTGYFKNVNPDLFNWVPVSAERVLELGCGEGALAAEYKRRNPRARYSAVEIHPPSAAVARERVDRLWEGAFESVSDEELTAEGLFDVVLMGDVLEHLVDPWAALSRVRGLLAPGGVYVASVPNISHWTAMAELMAGDWPARDSGLFDRTHLRFFTLKSLNAVLNETGFRPLKTKPRTWIGDKARAERWAPVLADAAERMGIDRKSFLQRASTLQYVVCAEKPKPATQPTPVAKLVVSAMAPLYLDVRGRLPAQHLDSLPDLSVDYLEKQVSLRPADPGAPKIALVQRLRVDDEQPFLASLARMIAGDWIMVADVDDHPSLMSHVRGREGRGDLDWLPLVAAHAVGTSTPALAEAFRARNPHVGLFPNAVFSLPPFEERAPSRGRIFYGALNREGFSRRVAAALAPAVEAHPAVEFVVVHDRAFFDALPTERKTFRPAIPYDQYLQAMAEADIVLSPLEGTFGETFKSDVKFLEAAARSVPMIASPAVYGDTIVDGETGLIAREIEDWPTALSRLLDEPELRRRLARNAWEYVRRERMFAYQAAARRDWYVDLWNQRAELNRSLLERVPGLAAHLPAGASGLGANPVDQLQPGG